MNQNDQNFQNLLTAMKDLGINGDPYEIAEEYGIFGDTSTSRENYRVDYFVAPFTRAMSVKEMKEILKDYKKDHE